MEDIKVVHESGGKIEREQSQEYQDPDKAKGALLVSLRQDLDINAIQRRMYSIWDKVPLSKKRFCVLLVTIVFPGQCKPRLELNNATVFFWPVFKDLESAKSFYNENIRKDPLLSCLVSLYFNVGAPSMKLDELLGANPTAVDYGTGLLADVMSSDGETHRVISDKEEIRELIKEHIKDVMEGTAVTEVTEEFTNEADPQIREAIFLSQKKSNDNREKAMANAEVVKAAQKKWMDEYLAEREKERIAREEAAAAAEKKAIGEIPVNVDQAPPQ